MTFQSLSRDSGRLNSRADAKIDRRSHRFQSLSRDSGRLNSHTPPSHSAIVSRFQSLSRDSGRLNEEEEWADLEQALGGFNPSVGIRGV